MDPADKRATYEDVLNAPDPYVAEVVDGDLYTSPRPASPHALAGTAVGQDLSPFSRRRGGSRGPGGWWILFEPELHLGPDILVPDLAGWRQERMPAVPNVPFFDLVPDWLCEVVSPSTGRLDRVRKLPAYAREGVEMIWLVDPLVRTLEVFRLAAGKWVLHSAHGGADMIRAAPFAEIEIDMSRWWID